MELVQGWWWESYRVIGSPIYMLAQKLKLLKLDLKRWNTEVFGLLKSQKEVTLAIINEVDRGEEAGRVSPLDVVRREKARADFSRLVAMEEISFRQKSRCLWLKEGDRNTKFFHRMANVQRRGNKIGAIKVDGVQCDGVEEARGNITEFFRNLYHQDGGGW